MIKKLKNKLSNDVQLNELIKGSIVTFVLKFGGMAISYLLIFILSQKLGPEGVGIYSFSIQVLIVASILLGFGMNISILKYLGQLRAKGESFKRQLLFNNYVFISGLASIISGFFLYVGAEYIAFIFGKDSEYIVIFKIIGITIPFYTLNQLGIEFIRGSKNLFISEFVRNVSTPLIIVSGLLLIVNSESEHEEILYLIFVAVIISFALTHIVILSALKKIPKRKANISFPRIQFLRMSVPMMLSTIANSLLIAMPIFFLDYHESSRHVGFFSVSFRLASISSLSLIIINTVIAPKVSELYYSGELHLLQNLIGRSVNIVVLTTFLSCLIIVLWSSEILTMFGEEFLAGYNPLIILIFGQFINAFTGPVGLVLNMCGKHAVYSYFTSAGLLIGFILLIIIETEHKLVYYAVIFSSIQVSINLASAIYIRYKLKIITFPQLIKIRLS